jgi:hypothetical protein
VSNKSESGSTLRLSLEEESFHGEHLKGCLGGARAPKRRAERRRAVEGLLAVLVVPSRRPLCLAHGLSCHGRPPPPRRHLADAEVCRRRSGRSSPAPLRQSQPTFIWIQQAGLQIDSAKPPRTSA